MLSAYQTLKQQAKEELERVATKLAASVPESALTLAIQSYWMHQPRGWALPELVEKIVSEEVVVVRFNHPQAYGAKNFRELKQILEDLALAWADAFTMQIDEWLEQPDMDSYAETPTFDEDAVDEDKSPPYQALLGYDVTFTIAKPAAQKME